MHFRKFEAFSDAYHWILTQTYNNPEWECSPRGLKSKEILNAAFELQFPDWCLYGDRSKARSSAYNYINAELIWYYNQSRDAKWISVFADQWDKIKDTWGLVHSSYGNIMFEDSIDQPGNYSTPNGGSQFVWALQTLLSDPESRKAVIHINARNHQTQSNLDFPCTMYLAFHIRDNRLFLTSHMRSQDLVKGLPTDIPFFYTIYAHMLYYLRHIGKMDLQMGTHTHIMNSAHIYDENRETVQQLLDKNPDDFISKQMVMRPDTFPFFTLQESGDTYRVLPTPLVMDHYTQIASSPDPKEANRARRLYAIESD
jgi:thymidylate synthase